MATDFNIYIDQGTTYSKDIPIVGADGEPVDLTNASLRAIGRKSYTSTSSYPFTISKINAVGGIVRLSLTATQTASMKSGRYVYDADYEIGGVVVKFLKGIVTVYPSANVGAVVTIPEDTTPVESVSGVIVYPAGSSISGHKTVRINSGGQVAYADSGNVSHANLVVGISQNAATFGDPINIQYSGEMIEPTWSWINDRPVFCGPNGALTQTPPTTGFVLIVGIAISATSIVINIKQPIIL